MGRLLLFLIVLALLWTLFRGFIGYLRDSAASARPNSAPPVPADDPAQVARYRRQGYRQWVRYRTGYTLYTRARGRDAETVVEEHSGFSPWFLEGSDEARRWLAEERALPAAEGQPWSERWIAGRGVHGDERRWLPPDRRPE